MDLNFTIHLFIGWFRQCDRFLQKNINWSDGKPTWHGTEAVLFLSDSDTCFGSIIHNLNSSRLWLVNCTHKWHWQCYSECYSLAWISATSPACWVTREERRWLKFKLAIHYNHMLNPSKPSTYMALNWKHHMWMCPSVKTACYHYHNICTNFLILQPNFLLFQDGHQ